MYGVRGLGVCWCVCMRVHVLKTTCKQQKTHVLPSLCAYENMIAETPLHFVHVFVRMYLSLPLVRWCLLKHHRLLVASLSLFI